jgi:hypothetical protein
VDCPNEKRENKNDKGKGSYKKDQKPHHKRRTMVEKLISVMNGILEMRALVKGKRRKLQRWLSRSFLPPQGCLTT